MNTQLVPIEEVTQTPAVSHGDSTARLTGFGAPLLVGVLVLLTGLSAFSIWGLLAPLDSAVIAPGVVVVENRRQQVEHLEGGIVETIHVRDGSEVRSGDVLLEIRSSASLSRLDQATRRVITLVATRDRLLAEMGGAPEIVFSERLQQLENRAAVEEDIRIQKEIFRQRRLGLEGQRQVTETQILQARASMRSITARLEADETRLQLARSRLERTSTLVENGTISQIQMEDVLAQQANLVGSISDLKGRLEERGFEIERLLQELENRDTEFTQSVFEELQRVETELGEFDASAAAATDVVSRMRVTAPVSGTVVGMAVSSVGSVVEGGELLLEIVPSEDRLIVEVLVRPEDIDLVSVGQAVQVRLSAFNQRTMPPVDGAVSRVSADRVVDQRSGVAGYSVVVDLRFTDGQQVSLGDIVPGMPVEVAILNDSRTFFDYLFGPVVQVFRRGMRE